MKDPMKTFCHLAFLLGISNYWIIGNTQAAVPTSSSDSVVPEADVIAAIEHAKQQMKGKLPDGSESLSPLVQTTLKDLTADMQSISTSFSELEQLYSELKNVHDHSQSLIREANARQLQHFVDQLEDTLTKEVGLRQKKKEVSLQVSQQNQDDEDSEDEDDNDGDYVIAEPEVTMEMVEERLDIKSILEESERELSTWILEVAKEELKDFKRNKLAKAKQMSSSATTTTTSVSGRRIEATTTTTTNDDVTDPQEASCPTTGEILKEVQQGLNRYGNDGIGLTDYARGAKIVHMMTSETYVPPPGPSQRLESVWWNKFIPEDWETFFPDGWKEWNVGIPDFIYHSLGFSGSNVAPPETVLQPKVLPGSCWPMAGSNGQVTMKLNQPVVIDSVSVDHVSSDIIPAGKYISAPKRLIVLGYPPCESDDEACASIGFDMNQEYEVARVTYNMEAGISVQTFDSHYGHAIKNLANADKTLDDSEDDDVISDDDGSCSSNAATSCSVPPKIAAAAVTFRVLDNWGDEDYTCIYRLRIHSSDEI